MGCVLLRMIKFKLGCFSCYKIFFKEGIDISDLRQVPFSLSRKDREGRDSTLDPIKQVNNTRESKLKRRDLLRMMNSALGWEEQRACNMTCLLKSSKSLGLDIPACNKKKHDKVEPIRRHHISTLRNTPHRGGGSRFCGISRVQTIVRYSHLTCGRPESIRVVAEPIDFGKRPTPLFSRGSARYISAFG